MPEETVQLLDLNEENIGPANVVCVRGPQNREGIDYKKEWLKARFKEGLKFKELIINGRSWGFIEYLPAEYAWRPIIAPGYTFVDCIWVIGRHKGKGYGRMLLEGCIRDSTDKNGVCVVTSDKPFLTSKDLYLSNGFEICDMAPPYYELLVRKNKEAQSPMFNESAKRAAMKGKNGLIFVYADQCPYIRDAIQQYLDLAEDRGVEARVVKLTSSQELQDAAPSPYGVFNVVYDGRLVTYHYMGRKEKEALIELWEV